MSMSLINQNKVVCYENSLIIDSSKVSRNVIKEILDSKRFKNILISCPGQFEYIKIIDNIVVLPLYFPLYKQNQLELITVYNYKIREIEEKRRKPSRSF